MRIKPIEASDKVCQRCGKTKNPRRGPDPCLGYLPGVRFACCGHGRLKFAYVFMEDGRVLRGQTAINLMEKLKKKRHKNV